MIYAYKCRTCGLEVDYFQPMDTLGPCTTAITTDSGTLKCPGELRRLFVVNMEPVMQEHFNATVNKPISSNRQFDDELRRQSERVSLYQGSEARFERVDPTDKAALGVTDQGIDESNRIRAKQGLPTFKT
jgi:hypothetical protein